MSLITSTAGCETTAPPSGPQLTLDEIIRIEATLNAGRYQSGATLGIGD